MNGTTHLIVGAAVGLATARYLQLPPGATVAALAVAGGAALAPDWLQINVPGLGKTIRGVFGHRGLTHWLLTAAALYLSLRSLSQPMALAAACGWASHIILDAFNAPGVPAFWPLWRLRLASFESGGWFDGVARFCAGLLALWGALRFIP